ncbi:MULTISPECIES: nuclear transport factor 2 family protein [Altibacter]|uniref:nuclear transport factor 2 family protein n=1 Tax=Altibacter TaxID=1535231 RepID=UPI001268600F|nr:MULTISPECIES: nuclear transport factor 2 family protein [Altibacter]MCW8980380.1 nuclear transport factor 2 family protein [Altibacter sp.]MCW9038067.1 nuclear transport factor 2 family protein [Altibacter sp.]
MKSFKSIFTGIFLIFSLSNTVNAQTLDSPNVESEIKEAAHKEQNAFKEGNCEQVLDLMDNEITFLANGKKVPSKQIISKFCNSIPRPFKEPISDKLEIYALSNESGYTIRTFEYPKDDTTNMQEYVTKIWKRIEGKWKITHLHSTVKEIPISD